MLSYFIKSAVAEYGHFCRHLLVSFRAVSYTHLDVYKRQVRAKLSPMISRNSRLAVRTKLTLYLLFLRTVLTYAAPAWWPLLSATNRHRLTTFQNWTLRSLTGSPWCVRNFAIHRGLRVPILEAFVWSLACLLYTSRCV